MYPIRLYLRHLPVAIMIGLSLLLNGITWVWPLWQIGPQSENIFLHYTILYGVDFVGEWWRVLYLPLIGLTIIIINTALSWLFFQKDKIISLFILAMSVLCQIFLCIAISLLVFLNV